MFEWATPNSPGPVLGCCEDVVFEGSFLNSFPRFPSHQRTRFVHRLVVWISIWTLLTAVAHAADAGQESQVEHLIHVLGLRVDTILSAMWVFVLGACIGSFLNVVIYRMPAGVALSHPGSRCPACETELTARDNIPILGWLVLRGRCRYCGVEISSRYPLIETLVGLVFLSVLLAETATGGANLPFHPPVRFLGGPMEAVFRYGRWDLVASFCLHAFYLTLVLAIGMIAWDGHRPPRQLLRTGVIVGLVVGVVWPALRPVHVVMPISETLIPLVRDTLHLPPSLGVRLVGLADGVAGLASGLLTGWLASRSVSADSAISSALRSMLILAGVICGWQMTWPLLAGVLVLAVLTKLFRSPGLQRLLPLILFVICWCFLLGWGLLLNGVVFIRYDGWQWSGTAPWVDWTGTVVLLSVCAVVLSAWSLKTDAED